ncbi:ABC transporter ATP-binding protein [Actinosynnema sp. NPDC047251]|uniref:ABC-type transporter, ATPase subunit n=1 Tax=Saccharothrix espanaensis (strain ATCC 51144 / DSM 44229 / JCM 9112 / NBRC 15066 / NRRL 15764) TaxID=1179773 RepID=K0JZQ1_SACES|nr:ABC transporter ATP-binding protein [Saccharothrix espanaensis]CCH30114.1 ABC-type transporter, ATPase subunit [Saccharothrix espanaensis DSM 44229]
MSLELHDITLTYPDGDGRLTALDQVTLAVPAGTLTALVGPSGSGKSSLLAVAATLVTPDSGTVAVDGVTTTGLSRGELAALRRRSIGTVFQQPNLLPSLTAVEQLQVMAHLDGRSPTAARPRALELLAAVGLADLAGRRPHQLSGGQRQRVNIARALVNDPKVLLVDEPTSALDHERGAAVLDLITRLTHRQATATVLVTHDRTHLTTADRFVEVHDGRLTAGVPVAGG